MKFLFALATVLTITAVSQSAEIGPDKFGFTPPTASGQLTEISIVVGRPDTILVRLRDERHLWFNIADPSSDIRFDGKKVTAGELVEKVLATKVVQVLAYPRAELYGTATVVRFTTGDVAPVTSTPAASAPAAYAPAASAPTRCSGGSCSDSGWYLGKRFGR